MAYLKDVQMFMSHKSSFNMYTYNKFQCIESSYGCSLNQFLIMHSLFPQWKFKINYDHIILRLPFVVVGIALEFGSIEWFHKN